MLTEKKKRHPLSNGTITQEKIAFCQPINDHFVSHIAAGAYGKFDPRGKIIYLFAVFYPHRFLQVINYKREKLNTKDREALIQKSLHASYSRVFSEHRTTRVVYGMKYKETRYRAYKNKYGPIIYCRFSEMVE